MKQISLKFLSTDTLILILKELGEVSGKISSEQLDADYMAVIDTLEDRDYGGIPS